MPTERNESHPDDAGIEELLREVGARHEPSVEASQEVEAAVHAEWRAMLAQRRARTGMVWGIAAGFAAIIAVGIVGLQLIGLSGVDIATVARVDGHLLAGARSDELQVRGAGVPIKEGEVLQTDDRSRVALVLANGVSVRLDRDTAVTFIAADRIELNAGALYVDDAHAQTPASAALVTVHTRAGSVRHVGTQYQVRSHAEGMAVSVREGKVLIEHEAGRSIGDAGESILVTTQGEVSRVAVSAHDPTWDWAAAAAPLFDIENQTLSAFLQWLARETGRQVVYATPQAEDAAKALRLRGSIEGLDLETALSAVLSTTQLRRYETPPDAIGIALSPPIGSAR